MITITVDNIYGQINGLTDLGLIDRLDAMLSYFSAGYQFVRAYKMRMWDGKNHLLTKHLKFQTGLLSFVEEFLQKTNQQYTLIDNREDVVLGEEIILNTDYYTPRDYQINAVEACLKEKCGIVKIATGGGKTLCLSMLVAKTNIQTVIYVISLDLLYQTHQGIQDALGIDVGMVGDGHCEIRQITVATPWTIAHAYDKKYEHGPDEDDIKIKPEKLDTSSKSKIKKMVESAKMFIFDEAQYLAASSCQLMSKNSKNARYRFGFSGTPWRDGGDDILLEASTGKTIVDVNATYLIDRGVLVPPHIYFFEVPSKNGFELNERKSYNEVYESCVIEHEVRNEMIIDAALKLFNKKRKTLILVKRKKHGVKLLEMMPKNIRTYYLNGDAKAEERQAVKNLFNMGSLDIIIASSIFDTGIDLPMLDALILSGGGKSSTRSLQRIGRVIRSFAGKKDAIITDFIDMAPYLYQHAKQRYKIYQTEKGFKLKLPPHIEW